MMDGAPTGGPVCFLNCWLQSFNYFTDLISSLQSVLLDNFMLLNAQRQENGRFD